MKAFKAQYPATFGIGTRPRAEEMNIILFGFVFVLGLGEQERERGIAGAERRGGGCGRGSSLLVPSRSYPNLCLVESRNRGGVGCRCLGGGSRDLCVLPQPCLKNKKY